MLRCVVGGIHYGDRHKILRIGYVDFFTSPLFFCAVKKSIAIFRVGEMAMHFGLFFLLYYFTSMPIMLYFLLSLMMRI